MSRTVYLDGDFVDETEALLPPTDVGVLYGLGSFETVRLYGGVPFLADRHERRMRETLRRMDVSWPDLDVTMILMELSRRNRCPDARARVVVTGGRETPDGGGDAPRAYAEVNPLPTGGSPAEGAVAVHLASGVLGGLMPLPGVKSLSYLPNYLARREARRLGADEAILEGPGGELLEGATSNFFLVLDGTLVTPPADGRLLEGVTRGVVLEEAEALALPVAQRAVYRPELESADEAFLTSSVREVLPIRGVDGKTIPAPGPITTAVREAYRSRVRRETGSDA